MRRTVLLASLLSFVSASLGAALAVGLLVPPLVEAQETRLRADSLTIASAGGVDRIRLSQGPGELSTLQIVDTKGQIRTNLAYGGPAGDNPESQGARFRNAAGRSRAFLGVLAAPPENLDSVLELQDAQGLVRLILAVSPEGDASIQFRDADGNVTWSAP